MSLRRLYADYALEPTQAAVRLALAVAEAEDLRNNVGSVQLHADISPSALIMVGLDIEGLQ